MVFLHVWKCRYVCDPCTWARFIFLFYFIFNFLTPILFGVYHTSVLYQSVQLNVGLFLKEKKKKKGQFYRRWDEVTSSQLEVVLVIYLLVKREESTKRRSSFLWPNYQSITHVSWLVKVFVSSTILTLSSFMDTSQFTRTMTMQRCFSFMTLYIRQT